MPRKEIVPEELFYSDVTTLIKNCFIDNPNFKNGYYFDPKRHQFSGLDTLIKDIQFSATLILDTLEKEKHLIEPIMPVKILVVTCVDSASRDQFDVYLKIDNLQELYPEFAQMLTPAKSEDIILDLASDHQSRRSYNLDDDTVDKYVEILIGNYTDEIRKCRYDKNVDGSIIDVSFGATVIY